MGTQKQEPQFSWYTLKCARCGLIQPVKFAVNGAGLYKCHNCTNTTFDEDYGIESVPAEMAENWKYPTLLSDYELRKLELLQSKLLQSGDLPGHFQPTRQMRLL